MMKKALICGVSGQDGAYLSRLLLKKGYEVYGTSRDAGVSPFGNLIRLGLRDDITLMSMILTDFRSVIQVINKVQPDEIYNLAGPSSVGLSFDQPVETLESIATGTLNLLESIRFIGYPIRLYNACSSEAFGNTGNKFADETTPFRPRSPYAVANATSFWEVANYREAYGLFACSGILFNHESPLRPKCFVTQKIITSAIEIAGGGSQTLQLGNIKVKRDWGWAPEYVDTMHRMLLLDEPDDFVIATGATYSLEAFVEQTFAGVGLDWRDHVETNPSLFRPTDIEVESANPAKARKKLGWIPKYKMPDVVRLMLEAEMMKKSPK